MLSGKVVRESNNYQQVIHIHTSPAVQNNVSLETPTEAETNDDNEAAEECEVHKAYMGVGGGNPPWRFFWAFLPPHPLDLFCPN
jgi:hypothetical protein